MARMQYRVFVVSKQGVISAVDFEDRNTAEQAVHLIWYNKSAGEREKEYEQVKMRVQYYQELLARRPGDRFYKECLDASRDLSAPWKWELYGRNDNVASVSILEVPYGSK